MSIEKIREQFVSWIESLNVGYDTRFAEFSGGLNDGEFYDAEVQGLWTTWQASRLAIEIERDQFKAENERLNHAIAAGSAREWDLRSQVKAAKESRARVAQSNKAVRAECEELRKDSGRYRWFRDCGKEWCKVLMVDSHDRIICEHLDDSIDAAISSSKKACESAGR